MLSLHNYEIFLKKSVNVIEIFTYTISVIIILLSVIYSVIIYIREYNYPKKFFSDIRLLLGETISLALSFILTVEILRIFYIKTYKQLIIIVSLTLLKLTINYFLLGDIEKELEREKELQNEETENDGIINKNKYNLI
jgi:uncharacterized membrane protein